MHHVRAIRVIICHYPTNVYLRHLMGHQAGPRYGVSHGGRRMKIGANFRYVVGQLYGDRRSSDIVRRYEAFIEHRYNQEKRHKALRESLRLMARIKFPNSRIRRKNRGNSARYSGMP